jgi:hypothetical protein
LHILSLHEWVSQEVNPLRPDGSRAIAGLGSFTDFESSGRSTYDGLQMSLQKRLSRDTEILVSYTLSKHTNLSDDIFLPGAPQTSFEWEAERGSSLRDQRHRFVLSGLWMLPYEFKISGIFTAASARPFNVITGCDDNGDGMLKDGPPGVGRNSERGSNYVNLDLRISKQLVFREDIRLELLADFFNITNHDNFDPESFNGVITSENFGNPAVAFNPRLIQFGARVQF